MDAFDRAAEREERAQRDRRMRPVWNRFLIHLRIYLTVNLVLAAVWVLRATFSDNDEPRFLGVLGGWGIGLLVHYLVVTQITRRWLPPPPSRTHDIDTRDPQGGKT